MKAILILDEMPKNCADCTFGVCSKNGAMCVATNGWTGAGFLSLVDRPSDCPLKSMPERKNDELILCTSGEAQAFLMGFNSCLDALEGGGQNED